MPEGGPSVVFVVLDTVRKDRLGPYGYDRGTTPELDAFADEAAVFEEAVAPAPWTLPVHASMFTGLYPGEHGADQESPYLEGAATLAESLSAGGVATACFSANAWITPYTGLTRGFDVHDNFFEVMPGGFLSGPLARLWRTVNDHERLRGFADRAVELGNAAHERLAGGRGADSKTPRAIDRAIDFLGSNDAAFCFLNLMDAHLPYYPPAEYADAFAPGVDASAVCQNAKEFNAGARDIDADEWDAIRGLYDAEIRHLDAEVGRLFDWLRSAGRWEETLVVVCADHGELHGEHGLYGHEFAVYEPLVNVPLFVKAPGLGAGRRSEQTELVGLYDTVLDFAGVDPVDGGRSIEADRSVLDPGFDGAAEAFVEYARPVVELNQLESKARRAGVALDPDSRFYSRMRAVRRPDAKYIENERIDDEFYRLDRDPDETTNLHAGSGPIADELRDRLTAFVRRTGAAWGPDESMDDDDVLDGMDSRARDRLRDLGYLE